jgi:hypothetical protein
MRTTDDRVRLMIGLGFEEILDIAPGGYTQQTG